MWIISMYYTATTRTKRQRKWRTSVLVCVSATSPRRPTARTPPRYLWSTRIPKSWPNVSRKCCPRLWSGPQGRHSRNRARVSRLWEWGRHQENGLSQWRRVRRSLGSPPPRRPGSRASGKSLCDCIKKMSRNVCCPILRRQNKNFAHVCQFMRKWTTCKYIEGKGNNLEM